jgi:mono/diheme cytochrome c family protein
MIYRIRDLTKALLCLALRVSAAAADPGDAALSGNHPLTQTLAGELLISELRCAACHSGVERNVMLEKAAPDLAEAGARISPEFLRRYLASPSTVHPGTTMPDVLASQPEEERAGIAEALTHFLISQSKQTFAVETAVPANLPDGKELFHSVGCVACHGPKEVLVEATPVEKQDEDDEDRPVIPKPTFKPIAISLGHIAGKYSPKSLSEFLFQPLRVRSTGRMPDMKLTPAESQAIAQYLTGGMPQQHVALVPQESLVAKGKRHFQELNCAACHTLSGIPTAAPVLSLKGADLSRGCLSPTAGRNPQFHLAAAQVQAISGALRTAPQVDTDSVLVAKTLTSFRCIACHVRDNYGGVPEEYSPFFTTSEKMMGDDGRIPPPLTLLGAKLQPAWLKKVLFDGESVRPYMATRMPQYGTANLGHLPEVFSRLDVLEDMEMKIPSPESDSESVRERERTLRKAGQELLGNKGLNCIACHNFNGKPAPVNKGIDLMTTHQRLQPGWFNRFSRNPSAFRPRTIMPTAWPNGVAAHKTILEGDTDRQIEAIWYYLSLGTSAADPPGIRSEGTKLSVSDKARTFRGRSRVAGFRGIAVGLPGQLNYAFNAETGTLSAIWKGDFIGVNWNGQGAGDFNPASEPITLAQDVSFVPLADAVAAWPLMPVMTKEAKVNPNPLYPKNVGYQFRGYFLGEASVPTFMYRSGTIEIEDRSAGTDPAAPRQLKRVLQFDSPSPQTVWFRALTGEISQESERVFRSGRLRLTIPAVEATLRTLSEEPKRSELLLRLQIPQGRSTQELLYEPLDK